MESADTELYEMIPNGIKEELPNLKLKTLGITLLGFLILAKALFDKSKEKVEVC